MCKPRGSTALWIIMGNMKCSLFYKPAGDEIPAN